MSNPTDESQHDQMSRICASLRVNEQGGRAKRNVMQPHVPSVKVPYKEHHDRQHSEIPVKAKLFSEDPTQRIRDRITNEARDTPKIVWVSTAFSRRQDIQLTDKLKDMRMKISWKGCDVAMKNLPSELWTG